MKYEEAADIVFDAIDEYADVDKYADLDATDQDTLEDLGFDSLDQVELAMIIEEQVTGDVEINFNGNSTIASIIEQVALGERK